LTGASTTFTAGSTAGSGTVTATLGAITGSASITVSGVTAPPSNLVASRQGKHISLSWRGSGSGVTYNIYRGTSPGGESPIPYKTGLAGTAAIDAAVLSGTTYYYKVTAVGPSGESAPSNEASVKAK
jgi:titin